MQSRILAGRHDLYLEKGLFATGSVFSVQMVSPLSTMRSGKSHCSRLDPPLSLTNSVVGE